MPLRDHFHPPLSELRHWESFHSRWASAIADHLDGQILPEGYFAEVQVHVGNRVEVDIAAFEEKSTIAGAAPSHSSQTATAAAPVWAPSAPAMKLPAYFPDRIEVQIFHSEAGPTLVSAIELVSPRNKVRPQSRRDFAIKCAAALRQGLGLLIVDVVTNRRSNLHNEMMTLLDHPAEFFLDDEPLYAVSYQPRLTDDDAEIAIWHEALSLGHPLPTLPLPLDKGQTVPLDLEETYKQTCRRMRLPDEGQ